MSSGDAGTADDAENGLAEATAPFDLDGRVDSGPATDPDNFAPDAVGEDEEPDHTGLEALAGVVCLGASAGGLEPLEVFFDSMPSDTGLAFIIIQHLSPDFKSLMNELLLRHTTMPIKSVEESTQLERNTIHLIPPRYQLTLENGLLRLQQNPTGQHMIKAIDTCMRSVADEMGAKSVGIVFSGTGSDGSRGLRAIADVDGLAMAQSPESCKFDAMPRNALMATPSALVCIPSEMPERIERWLAGIEPIDPNAVASTDPYERILRMLHERYRANFRRYKIGMIERRIERRQLLGKIASLNEYAELLEHRPEELESLYCDILIGVTSFFRDAAAFEFIEGDVLPDLMSRMSDQRPIRLWVAACATGEEAYSLGIMLLEQAAALDRKPNFKIFATDLHQNSLEFAGRGIYSAQALAGMSKERMERFFEPVGTGFRVCQQLRRMIVFSRHDILDDTPFTRIDIVSCRNLLIYFGSLAQRRALAVLHFALARGGTLFLGPSETLGDIHSEFTTLSSRWRVYRKLRDAHLMDASTIVRDTNVGLTPTPRLGVPTPRLLGHRHLLGAYDHMLARYAPPSLLINRDGELLHVFGNARELLRMQEGLFSSRLVDLLPNELKLPLSGSIERAWRQRTPVSTKHILHRHNDATAREVAIFTVEPLAGNEEQASYLLVSITRQTDQLPPPLPPPADDVELHMPSSIMHTRIQALERDLKFTEESLQSTIEELETSNEELQATNEELMASNEELQSTNEELSSVNEELFSVSAEHQRKIDELTALSNDIENLQRSTRTATLFVDAQILIRRFTPAAAELFNVVPHDIGRPLQHVTFRFHAPTLHDDVAQVLESGESIEREIRHEDDRAFYMRILPYLESDMARAGIVLTFFEVTELKLAKEKAIALEADLAAKRRAAVESERDRLFSLFRQAPVLVSIHEGADHRLVLANPHFENAVGRKDVVGLPLCDVVGDRLPVDLVGPFDAVLATGDAQVLNEVLIASGGDDTDGRRFTVVLQPYASAEGEVQGVMCCAYDVTDVTLAKHEAERLTAALRLQKERLHLALAVGGMAYCSIDIENQQVICPANLREMLQVPGGETEVDLNAFLDMLDSRSAKRLRDLLEAEHEDGTQIDLELELCDIGTVPAWVRLVGRIRIGQQQEFHGIIADISDRKSSQKLLVSRADQLGQANDQLEHFVFIVSHDLKSPLRGIQHLANFLREDLGADLDDKCADYLDRLEQQVVKMSRMLDDLLAYARLDNTEAERVAVQPEALVREAATLIGLPDSFELLLDDAMPSMRTTPAALSLVLRNLISNAAMHHDRDKGRIWVRCRELEADCFELAVSDDGPGIPKRYRSKVFEFFQSLPAAAPTRGSGMGLTFVKRAVNANGGTVTIEDRTPEPGESDARGTTVRVIWKAEPVHDKAPG